MNKRKKATLLLQDGREFSGWSFGYDGPSEGEIVFSTAMVGYPESLTDPSYSGQILCVSYPLVGNYGIPDEAPDAQGLCTRFESEKIHVRGLVIADYSEKYSHWDASKSLEQWLQEQHVPGICGIDTRALVQLLRDEGAQLGAIVPAGSPAPAAFPDPNLENQVAIVSCREVIRYGSGPKRVVLVDCGVKHQIIRCLLKRGIEVVRVPWDYDFKQAQEDGLDRGQLLEKLTEGMQLANLELDQYCKLSRVEIVDQEFEKTPKRSIKRYLYQRGANAQ